MPQLPENVLGQSAGPNGQRDSAPRGGIPVGRLRAQVGNVP